MGSMYHINNFNNISLCNNKNCKVPTHFHFSSICQALDRLEDFFCLVDSENMKVTKYNKLINYNAGETHHFKEFRRVREKELKNLLGESEVCSRFLVVKSEEDVQIQEILANGILNVYSYTTHKKITTFAPTPERITSLYHSIGEFPPEELIMNSESNVRKGYNNEMWKRARFPLLF